MSVATVLKPFKHRNFVLFLLAEFIYRVPVWMGALVFGLLVKQWVGNSTFYEGMVGFAYNLPMLLFTPFTGVLADRFNRLKIIRLLQILYFVLSAAVALALAVKLHSVLFIVVMIFFIGVGFSIGSPALLATIPNLVDDPEIKGTAVSLVMAFNRSFQFLAYAIGGFLFAWLGAMNCFVISCVCFVVAFVLFHFIKVNQPPPQRQRHPIADLKTGFSFVHKQFAIRATLLLLCLNGLFAWPYIFQMPIVNGEYFGGAPAQLGIIMACGGIGGTIGALMMGMKKDIINLTKLIRGSAIIVGASLITLSLSRSVSAGMVAAFFLDLGMSMLMVSVNIFLQRLCTDDIRGRLMGVFMMSSVGLIPVGSLLFYGVLGQWVNLMHLFFVGGVIFFVGVVAYSIVVSRVRANAAELYRQANPEVEAIQAARI